MSNYQNWFSVQLPAILFFLVSSIFNFSSSSFFLAPVTKDQTSSQYIVSVYLRTPLQPTNLLLDLGSSFSWVDCTQHYYSSSTYHSIPCNSSLCVALESNACSNCFHPAGPGCSNDSCALFPENSVTRKAIIAQALVDSLALPTTDGRNPGQLSLLHQFIFSCGNPSLLEGIAKNVTGFAGLGRSNFSLPAQISTAFSSPCLFALCLSGSPSAPGVVFFNTAGPYYFFPEIDLSKSLTYTPLLLNPLGNTVISYQHPSDEYFIGLTSINVNGKPLQLNQTLLTVDQNGFGGTKLSTATPYTILESSIYKALTDAFMNESAALNFTATSPVKPFNVCYNATDVLNTKLGPGFPTVDLVMQSNDVFWRLFGANSMVRIASGVTDLWCLGFLDGGANLRTSIVIGGHQMEDNLLQFDLRLKRLGFTSSVLVHKTMCSNFNFTTTNASYLAS